MRVDLSRVGRYGGLCAAACCALALGSCQEPRPAGRAVSIAAAGAIVAVYDGPATAKQLTATPLSLRIADRSDREPIRGAVVRFCLIMPSMPMPPNTVRCREVLPGRYTGIGVFTMPGDWRVEASVASAKGSAAISAPVTVR